MTLKEYLSSLSDNRFLETASLYLGKVEMPFNKARLTEALISFFSNEEIRRYIVARCDDEDANLISALCFLRSATAEELIPFSKEGRLKTLMRIRSLEKRLLLLSAPDGRLYPSDFLDYAPIISSAFIPERTDVRDTRIAECIAGMLSIIASGHFRSNASRAERSFISADICLAFPLLSKEESQLLFSSLLQAGLAYGFIRDEGGYVNLDKEETGKFLSLDIALQAAIITSGGEKQSAEFLEKRASLISLLASTSSLLLPISLKLAASEEELNSFISTWSFLIPSSRGEEKSTTTISADFTLLSRSFRESHVYMFASLSKADALVTYELTRESVKAGFDMGITADDITNELDKLGAVPSIVRERISSWYSSYEKIRVYDSLFVEADERSARLIASLPLLQIHIIRRIGETGFLFKRKTEEQWRRIMMYSGLDMIGRTEKEEGFIVTEQSEEEIRRLPDGLELFTPYSLESFPEERTTARNTFRDNLLRLTINERIKDKGEKDGYLSYLSKGYIIADSQIIKGKQFPHPRSATGFDFQAKLQLLASVKGNFNTPVSLTLEEETVEGVVLSLERKAEDSFITLERADDDAVVEIPVAKIFLIKTIID